MKSFESELNCALCERSRTIFHFSFKDIKLYFMSYPKIVTPSLAGLPLFRQSIGDVIGIVNSTSCSALKYQLLSLYLTLISDM